MYVFTYVCMHGSCVCMIRLRGSQVEDDLVCLREASRSLNTYIHLNTYILSHICFLSYSILKIPAYSTFAQ